MATSNYALGHSGSEMKRLTDQARDLNGFTRDFLRQAGIESGMRILDIGCGAGDVSFVAANLVGENGEVVGIDRAAPVLSLARSRAEAGGLANVHFVQGDAIDFKARNFDAVIGRLVLMHTADPASLLRHLSGQLGRGSIVAFQEYDILASRAFPDTPLLTRPLQWIIDTLTAAGADVRCGLRLNAMFHEAGLPEPALRIDAVIGGANTSLPDLIAETTRTLLPLMETFGVATADEVQIETLADRIREELRRTAGTAVAPPLIGASVRL